jgi:hypothetical protein
MTDMKRNADISAEERREIFHDTYGNAWDAGLTLAELLRGTGDYLAALVGEDLAAGAMYTALAPLVGSVRSSGPADWRTWLKEAESDCFTWLPIGANLHNLTAYADYGILLVPEDEEDKENEAWLQAAIAELDALIGRSPLAQWLGADRSKDLEGLALLARNRWALDTGRPVEPAALASFGRVSEGRMRNMMSGAKRDFTPDDGRIPAAEALAWLAGRPEFYTSIWRDQLLPHYLDRNRPPLDHPVFAPVARDESMFHPGLRRNGTYTVGPKGDETHIADYHVALEALQRMPAAYWRRPNDAGAWGVVRAVEWMRLDMSDLDAIAATLAAGLAPE